MNAGTGTTDRRSHQHRATERSCGVEQAFRAGRPRLGVINPRQQCVKNDAAQHHAAVVSLGVDAVWVPFAEHVVRAFVDWVQLVMRPHVDGQLFHLDEIEVGFEQEVLGGLLQKLHRR